MSSLSENEKNLIKTFCGSSSIPTILINDNLICEYSNDESFYPVGVHFASVLEADVELKKDKTVKTMVKIKDKYYCAVINPVTDEFFICQMFDSDNIFEMAQYSAVYDEILPVFSSNGIDLGEIEDRIKELVLLEEVKENHKLDTDLLLLASKIATARGRYEDVQTYFDITFSKNNKQDVFSLYKYVKWCVDRCNSVLSNTGRYIELNCGDTEPLVSANSRHTIFGFVEMIRFVLLNSAVEFSPFISIENNNGAAELMITCRSLIYVPQGGEDEFIETDVSKEIAMVRRFAKRCKAEFRFINEKDNIIGFKLLFPKVVDPDPDILVFEDDVFIDFDNAFSNYIKHKMGEVINAYKLQNGK